MPVFQNNQNILIPRGGKTCENGHFICANCVYGGVLDPTKSSCPLCNKPLR